MNIAIIAYNYLHWNGGAERYIDITARNLIKQGHNVTIYTAFLSKASRLYFRPNYPCSIKKINLFFEPGIKLFEIPGFRTYRLSKKFYELLFNYICSFLLIFDHLRGIKYDIVQGQAINALAPFISRKFTKTPYVCCSLNAPWALYKKYQNSLVSSSNGLICLNKATFKKHKRYTNNNLPDSKVIYIGIDTDKFHPNNRSKSLRKQWGVKRDELVLTTFQRMDARKNLIPLFEAFAQLTEDYPNIKIIIAGGGPHKDKYKSWVKDNGFDKKFIFLGYIEEEDLNKMYASSDIFIAATYGFVSLEAMASETATIIVDHEDQCKEFVIDGESGLLVDDNTKAIKTGIYKIIRNKKLRKDLSKNGRKFVIENHSEYDQTIKVSNFMKKILN